MTKYSKEEWEKKKTEFQNWLKDNPDATLKKLRAAGYGGVLQMSKYNGTSQRL